MKTYGQYCAIAKALDVIGERWTLLIVRELLLQGPRRFTDLKNGLPGIASNLLSDRLRDLEDADLVSREHAPPPVATTLYTLTPNGLALEPVLRALGQWGLQFMAVDTGADVMQPQWLACAAEWFTALEAPDGAASAIQLQSSGNEAALKIAHGDITARVGRVPDPDLVLDGPARAILGLLTGLIELPVAQALGLTATGDTSLVENLGRREASRTPGATDA